MHKPRSPESSGVNLGLIITPMLDMSFQILAFFIMTYHPSALEGHLAGSLAAADNGVNRRFDAEVQPHIARVLDEAMDILTVTITAGETGLPDKVLLKTAAEAVPIQVADGTMSWNQAKREVSRALQRRRADDPASTAVKLAPDARLRQSHVMEVYDVCKDVGYDRIHFVPPPIDRRAR
jgi:biopolymer transport protein ExbD